MVSNFALFCLATVLATFQKLGVFFQSIWSPCLVDKKCCLYHPRGQSYETFYSHNLQIFVVSLSVCIMQTFPA
jgi:hypothetical protein